MSTPEQPARPRLLPALFPRRTLLVWVCGLLLFLSLWGQHRLGLLPPSWLLFVVLAAALVLSTLSALVWGLWRTLRGPRRLAALGSVLLALPPPALFAVAGWYTQTQWASRRVPQNLLTLLGRMSGASLMRAEADLFYLHRLETERLVMYHTDPAAPEKYAREMDAHVARMEKLLGAPLRRKIHWARGPLLGQRFLSYYGLALGSPSGPTDEPTAPGNWRLLDRHELAHAVLDQYRTPDSDPPMLLHEGWAEEEAWLSPQHLAEKALNVRAGGLPHRLRELVGPEWYHLDRGPVYSVGGALVDFLLRRYGVEKFRRLYVECRPETFATDCRAILGVDLDDLEAEFWKDAEKTAARKEAPGGS
jgi:hypothetical protein